VKEKNNKVTEKLQININNQNNSIVFKDFVKKFKKTVIGPFTFNIKRGGVTAVLGESGSGKSVVLNSIMGIVKNYKGQLFVNGVSRKSPKYYISNSALGYYTQLEFNLLNIGVFSFLYDICLSMGIPKDQINSRIEYWLHFFDLYKDKDKLLKNFSFGMKNRVCFIICFINEPDIIILDEPGANLDSIWREKIKKLLIKYKEQKRTLIVTLHNIDEMNDIIDNYIIIKHGKLLFNGTSKELDLYIKYKIFMHNDNNNFNVEDFKEFAQSKNIKVFKYNSEEKTIIVSFSDKNSLNWINLYFIKKAVPIKKIIKLRIDMESILRALKGRTPAPTPIEETKNK